MNGSTNGNTSDTSAVGWGASDQIIGGGEGNSTFYALSINREGGLVEVLNSDLGFVLLYANNVSANIIQATIEALQPYPRGLLTNVGMVVANAAYDSNTTNIEVGLIILRRQRGLLTSQVFNNLQYHGAVSWSWQQGIMAAGVSKQLGLCGASNNTQLEQTIPGELTYVYLFWPSHSPTDNKATPHHGAPTLPWSKTSHLPKLDYGIPYKAQHPPCTLKSSRRYLILGITHSQLVIWALSVRRGLRGMRFNCGVMGFWLRWIPGRGGL
jgi:hypothetical protein